MNTNQMQIKYESNTNWMRIEYELNTGSKLFFPHFCSWKLIMHSFENQFRSSIILPTVFFLNDPISKIFFKVSKCPKMEN